MDGKKIDFQKIKKTGIKNGTGRSSGFKHTAIYESERKNDELTHNDFSFQAGFEEINNEKEIYQHFQDNIKKYDRLFFNKRGNRKDIEISNANKFFFNIYNKFKDTSDSVEIFHCITYFFEIDSNLFYKKLVSKMRLILIHDLKERIYIKLDNKIRIDKKHNQCTFKDIPLK